MSTEMDSNCPICQDICEDVASTLPCHHQFCLGCILRWTQRNPICPLCRRTIVTVRFSVHGEDDYLETSITVPEELPDGSSQAERAPGSPDENRSHPPVVSPPSSPQGTLSPAEQEDSGLELVGNVLPEVWAEIFRQRRHLLDPVQPWLHERLQGIYQRCWWVVDAIESSILHGLCIYGPNAEMLVEVLQPLLEEHTAPLVHDVISIIMGQCCEEAQRLLSFGAVGDENNGPVASYSSTSSSSSSTSSRSINSRISSFSSCSSNSCSSSNSQQETPNISPTGCDEEEEAGTSEVSPCPGQQSQPLCTQGRD
ncbi:hypothetical protein HGM15179_017373 [Zosterops borbonicus]|uniref:RING-type E3 ubiquitin transferase n=1 Tax=Zosterops borbonicus TaxID=364589 RepID=A0A8K1G0Y5_9PASS|nr:hypothetical protein HGM15179_017373 [Zosterops borbonicus]